MSDLLAQARAIGERAARAEAELRRLSSTQRELHDDIHHPGDDTGRLMWEAYRQRGAAGAVDVLDAYLEGFESVRIADGMPVLDPNDIAVTLGWAASVRANTGQIGQIRAEFCRRQNITSPSTRHRQ